MTCEGLNRSWKQANCLLGFHSSPHYNLRVSASVLMLLPLWGSDILVSAAPTLSNELQHRWVNDADRGELKKRRKLTTAPPRIRNQNSTILLLKIKQKTRSSKESIKRKRLGWVLVVAVKPKPKSFSCLGLRGMLLCTWGIHEGRFQVASVFLLCRVGRPSSSFSLVWRHQFRILDILPFVFPP